MHVYLRVRTETGDGRASLQEFLSAFQGTLIQSRVLYPTWFIRRQETSRNEKSHPRFPAPLQILTPYEAPSPSFPEANESLLFTQFGLALIDFWLDEPPMRETPS